MAVRVDLAFSLSRAISPRCAPCGANRVARDLPNPTRGTGDNYGFCAFQVRHRVTSSILDLDRLVRQGIDPDAVRKGRASCLVSFASRRAIHAGLQNLKNSVSLGLT